MNTGEQTVARYALGTRDLIISHPFCVSLISKDLTHTYPAVCLSVDSPGYYLILVGTEGEKEHIHLTVLMFLLPEPVSQTHLSV